MDWVGSWFALSEKVGESQEYYVGRMESEKSPPEWTVFRHVDFDGMGAMTHLFHGPHVSPTELRPLRRARPGRLTTFWAFLKNHLRLRGHKTRWRSYDRTKVGVSPALAWICLDADVTARLNESARSKKISLNTLILSALDRTARSLWVNGGETCWIIPVNVRGAAGLSDEIANQFSSIQVLCSEGLSLHELHGRVRARFEDDSYWGVWSSMRIGRYIGQERLEKAYVKGYENPQSFTGTLSNVGEWESDRVAPGEDWIVGAITSKVTPIAVGVLTLNKKLSLSLQLHPTLGPSPERVRETMEHWARELKSISGVEATPTAASLENLGEIARAAKRALF